MIGEVAATAVAIALIGLAYYHVQLEKITQEMILRFR